MTSEACPHGSLSLEDPAEPSESPRALSPGRTLGPHWVPPSPRQHFKASVLSSSRPGTTQIVSGASPL